MTLTLTVSDDVRALAPGSLVNSADAGSQTAFIGSLSRYGNL